VERLDRGGLERTVEALSLSLDRNLFETEVWTLCGGGAVAESLRGAGIRVEAAGGGRPALRPLYIRRLAVRLLRHGADVVHGHGFLAGALARISGLLAGTRCRLAHRHTTGEGERLRHRWLERAIRRAGWTICCSEAVREHALRHACADPLRTEVVYNGVDTRRFTPDPAGPAEPRTILTVASLRRLKGHRVLLQAAAHLSARGLDYGLEFVGDGPEREALEEMSRSLGISSRVRFAGELDDVTPCFRRTGIFVLPSNGREGLGLAALEAMACGLPVVASRIGGLPETVLQGRTGFLVDPGDPGDLADALEILLGDPATARAMGSAGRDRVERHFDVRATAERTATIYLRGLSRSEVARSVLYLSSRGTRFGGGQEGLRLLATGLDPDRYRPVVVVPEPGDLNVELSSAGVRTLRVALPSLRSWNAPRVVTAILRLRRLCRMVHPDLVHADSTRTAVYAALLSHRIRKVWHLRDIRPDGLDRWLYRFFHRLVAVSHAAAARFGGDAADLVEVVPNSAVPDGASNDRMSVRRNLGIPDDGIVLLSVGRVEREKGVEDLVRAIGLLKGEEGPSLRALVAGEDVGGEIERLRRLASDLGIGDRIRFLHRREDVADLMGASDILVHPSWYEAAPRVVLEAMACGLPVLATDVGGTPEVLGGSGRLVPVGDVHVLACEIADLATDPEERNRLSGLALDRFRNRFRHQGHLNAMHELYDRLLDGAKEWERAS
jgi:glycosyltransferase involved in cell wall biosynthesis